MKRQKTEYTESIMETGLKFYGKAKKIIFREVGYTTKTVNSADLASFFVRISGDTGFAGETGLYYYGARYLDPRVSRWLSADPALGDYIPEATADEEARRRNGNLPGMGGIYNYVNLHAYHYAGNNPIKYVDPDGNTTWLPLTYSALWSNAFRSGAIDPNNDYGPNNNIIGLALERAVGQIFGMQRNNVNFPNNISSSRVRPDFVGRSNFAFVDEHGRVSSTVFPTGNFIEAKTSRIVNGEGSGNNQIFAMIDALSNQRSANGEMTAGEARAGYLYLVTPADTVITQDVVSYATLKNVRLHQFTAEYNKDNPNQIRLGRGQPLNFLDGGQIILAPRRTGTLDY